MRVSASTLRVVHPFPGSAAAAPQGLCTPAPALPPPPPSVVGSGRATARAPLSIGEMWKELELFPFDFLLRQTHSCLPYLKPSPVTSVWVT